MPVIAGSTAIIADHGSTNKMIAGYSRNPAKFRIAKYAQYTKVDKPVAVYMKWNSQQAARIVDDDGAEFNWIDGADRPSGANNQEAWEYVPFSTTRRDFPFTLGNRTVESFDWPIVQAHTSVISQQCMTLRTMHAIRALTLFNWGNNAKDVEGATGITGPTTGLHWGNGSWGGAAGVNAGALVNDNKRHIQRSLNYASNIIIQETLATVDPSDIMLLVSPNAAFMMSEAPELMQYLANSPFALAQIRGDSPSQNGKYGLPDVLYSHDVAIEDAVRIKTSKNISNAATKSYVIADNTAFLLSRPMGIDGVYGSPSFSTLQFYYYNDEMSVQMFNDPYNERTTGHIVSDYEMIVPNGSSGFKFTRCFGGTT